MPATPWNRTGKTRCLPSRNFHSSGKVTPRQIRSLPPPLFALVYSYNQMNTTSDWPEGSLCFRSQVMPPICCHILPPLTQGKWEAQHGPLGFCLTTGVTRLITWGGQTRPGSGSNSYVCPTLSATTKLSPEGYLWLWTQHQHPHPKSSGTDT